MPLSAQVIAKLVNGYRLDYRAFPWRKSPANPYEIWISEVMSQQSTMASVVPYFERWLKRFPTLSALASAEAPDVLEMWAGLGYYSRARNIHKSAQILNESLQKNGSWPRELSYWLELPGLGPYTAAAVCAIAFDQAVLPLDGNITRVFARLRNIEDPLNQSSQLKLIRDQLHVLAQKTPAGQHGTLAQALMELGARICRPGSLAVCDLCPLQSECEAFRLKRVALIPKAKKRPEFIKVQALMLKYRNAQGELLLRQIPEGARLAGQWEIPWLNSLEDLEFWQSPDTLHQLQKNFVWVGPVNHSITRYRYKVYAVEAGLWRETLPKGHCFWTEGSKAPGPLTTLSRKILLLN